MAWDPGQYLRFSDARGLPFHHLTAALEHVHPDAVVDLGCGPGGLTATLLERWPGARITGVDTSPEMIAHAKRREIPGRLEFEIGEASTWRSTHPVDLVLSNACFHWIDDHQALLKNLDEDEQLEFISAYGRLLRGTYPERDGTTLFPFKRLFIVATRQ